MIPEIKEGDYLACGGHQYAVRSVEEYIANPPTASLRHMAHFTASITRRQQIIFAGLQITAIDPASKDAYSVVAVTQAPVKLYEAFVVADDGYVRLYLEKTKK